MNSKFRLQWPVDSRTITQRFGENPHIYAPYHQPGHEGLDFSASVGDNVYACADGAVYEIRPEDGNAYGLHVRIRHRVDGLEYHTVYAHLSRALVSNGQQVRASDRIALSGRTGNSPKPHLHLTLKLTGAQTPGYPEGVIDPLSYLQEVEIPAPSGLTIYTTEEVRLRAGPTTASAQLALLEQGEALTVLGDAEAARARVGQPEQWIQVQRANGLNGYVAAWYVGFQPPSPAPPAPVPVPAPAGSLVVYAAEPLNVRKGPSTETSRLAIALPDEPLTVLGDRAAALAILGDRGEWYQVRLPGGLKGHVAAWYVQTEPGLALPSLLAVYPAEDLNVREGPSISAPLITRLAQGTPLTVHDDPERAQALVGRYDEWLYVETGSQRGWVAAWYVGLQPPRLAPSALAREAVPAGPLVVYATEPLNVRKGPSTETSRIAIALPQEPLSVIGDQWAALSMLGKHGEWLRVRLPNGLTGYVAAWYVQTGPGPAPEALLTVYPIQDLNLRQRPAVKAGRVAQPVCNTPLTVRDDAARARALVGRYDEWLYVETPEGQRGWVAAWYVSMAPAW